MCVHNSSPRRTTTTTINVLSFLCTISIHFLQSLQAVSIFAVAFPLSASSLPLAGAGVCLSPWSHPQEIPRLATSIGIPYPLRIQTQRHFQLRLDYLQQTRIEQRKSCPTYLPRSATAPTQRAPLPPRLPTISLRPSKCPHTLAW